MAWKRYLGKLLEIPIEGISAEVLLADRGYDTNSILTYAVSAGIEAVIPSKNKRKEQRQYNKYLYKLRHLAGNVLLVLKRWRSIATRYAKTSDTFIALYRYLVFHSRLIHVDIKNKPSFTNDDSLRKT